MKRCLLPALLLAATACYGAPDAGGGVQIGVDEAIAPRIVNGTPSTSSDDAVVMLGIGSDGLCTGTLLTPNLVITARHCLSNMDESTECGTFTTALSPSTITVSLGANASPSAVVAKGRRIFVDDSNNGCSHDIGLLLLDNDVPGAKTAKVRFTKLTKGEPAKTVGYGEDGKGQLTSGRYVKTGLAIDAVGPSSYTYETRTGQAMPVEVPSGELVTGESTCFGDSGGPLFDGKGAVIGVTSRGIDDSCIDRPSIYSDTASHEQLVRDAAKASGHALDVADAPSAPSDPAGSTSAPSSDGSGSPDESDTGSSAPTSSTKRPRAQAVASAGCNASSGAAAESAWIVALAIAVAVARRRGAT